jgi:hypothetical protein
MRETVFALTSCTLVVLGGGLHLQACDQISKIHMENTRPGSPQAEGSMRVLYYTGTLRHVDEM